MSPLGVLGYGDSKIGLYELSITLIPALRTASGDNYCEVPLRIGVNGATSADMAARVAADIVTVNGYAPINPPAEIIVNLGANDVADAGFTKAAYKANMNAIIQALHAAIPAANIRITKIWRRNYAVNYGMCNDAIDELYTANAWLKTGIDETLILPGGDDGATNTDDGIHPNATGYALITAAWVAVIVGA
jgi:lysophospholipase L1-like esterase